MTPTTVTCPICKKYLRTGLGIGYTLPSQFCSCNPRPKIVEEKGQAVIKIETTFHPETHSLKL